MAILGGAFSLFMLRGFTGFADLSGLVVGLVVLAVGVGIVLAGRKRARFELETDDRHFSDLRELDLYVTATDIWGEVLPLRLHDKFVWEKRYKAVFHLTYRDSGARQDTSCAKTPAPQYRRNDFVKENNPFLAFASRATSSFPFAFQPMTLRDLQKLVRVRDGFTKEQLEEKLKEWKALFFSNPEQPKKGAAPWTDPADRPYSDGGCLDNKPFSHVTRALLQRAADVAVERKLLYVEPSPEHPEEIGPPRDRDGRVIPPDAIENSIRALIVLPADETIREDLERILDRNKGIERLNRLIRAIESDVFDVNGGDAERQSRIEKAQTRWENCSGAELSDTAKRADQWASRGLKVRSKPQDEVEQEQPKDARYSAYTRLKVSTVTDELAILISQLAGFDTESHESLAVRCLVKTWRDDRYSDVEGERTLGHFLLSFDCAYRLRRLQFVLRRIDDLLRSDRNDALNRLIRLVWPKEPESSARDVKDWNKEQHRRFKEELSKLRGCIGCALQILQTGLKILHTPRRKQSTLKLYKVVIATEHESVLQAVEALPLTFDDLYGILGGTREGRESARAVPPEFRVEFAFDESRAEEKAHALLERDEVRDKLNGLEGILNTAFRQLFDDAFEEIRPCFCADTQILDVPSAAAFRLVRYYYDFFEDYDSVLYPISYGTNVGEAAIVDVVRISPDDATSIVNESQTGKAKLAGVKLAHFGAFLDEVWRRNESSTVS